MPLVGDSTRCRDGSIFLGMIRVGTSLPLAAQLVVYGTSETQTLGSLAGRDGVVWMQPSLHSAAALRGLDAFAQAADDLADRGFGLLAITADPPDADVVEAAPSLPFPLACDPTQAVWPEGDPAWGGVLVTDARGTVRGVLEGSGSAAALIAFVDAMDVAADAEGAADESSS